MDSIKHELMRFHLHLQGSFVVSTSQTATKESVDKRIKQTLSSLALAVLALPWKAPLEKKKKLPESPTAPLFTVSVARSEEHTSELQSR